MVFESEEGGDVDERYDAALQPLLRACGLGDGFAIVKGGVQAFGHGHAAVGIGYEDDVVVFGEVGGDGGGDVGCVVVERGGALG